MKNKKNVFLYIGAAALLTMGSCTKNFDAINTDPTQATAANYDPNLLLSSQQIEYFNGTTGYSGALLLQSMWVQVLASAAYPSYYEPLESLLQFCQLCFRGSEPGEEQPGAE
jgi:hypothetical protein